MASIVTAGGSSNYHATKIFDDFFSRTIGSYMGDRVDVLTARPGRVTTPMLKNTTSLSHSTAQQTAKEVIDSLGNNRICYGPIIHRLQAAATGMFHEAMVSHAATVESAQMRMILQKIK